MATGPSVTPMFKPPFKWYDDDDVLFRVYDADNAPVCRTHSADAAKLIVEALNGIIRLGSMEAFGRPRAVNPFGDDELMMRIEFARSIIKND